jgi:hypothetical protein
MKSALAALLRRLGNSTVLVVAFVALLSIGTATAAKLITGADIKNHSITGKDIKKHSVPITALKGSVAGPPGPPGQVGEKGQPGQGTLGPEGPPGPSAFTGIFSLSSPIDAEVTPGTSPKFLGAPGSLELLVGDQGALNATVTVGTEGTPIDDPAKFRLTVCFQEPGGPVTVLPEIEPGKFGVSPVIGERTAVTVASGFVLEGEAEPGEEPFIVDVGPCVLNETATVLDDNDRVEGTVWFSGP